MDLFEAMGISANALQSQQVVIHSISTNLANLQTTGVNGGEPYRRRRAFLSQVPMSQPFSEVLSNNIMLSRPLAVTHPNHFRQGEFRFQGTGPKVEGVKAEVIEDPSGYQMIYDPSHPDADASGHVLVPNINLIEEMVTLLGAVRSYEANVTAFNAAKGMVLKALEIGR
jgi:flagellar basal-body rod protein FlgC